VNRHHSLPHLHRTMSELFAGRDDEIETMMSSFTNHLPSSLFSPAASTAIITPMSSDKKPPLHLELFSGGLANATASFLLNPADVVKIRLQCQNTPSWPLTPYKHGTIAAFKTIVQQEGVFVAKSNSGLWFPGMGASLVREISYSSFRFGLYSPFKSFFMPTGEEFLVGKILAGACAGAFGSFLAVPTDRMKIRLQREAGAVDAKTGKYTTGLFSGKAPTYPNNLFLAFHQMFVQEGGIAGMWVGWQPTMVRATFLAGAQLSSYDHSKFLMKKHGIMEDGVPLHVFSSLVAGVATLIATQPLDVMKSRIMALDGEVGAYKGIGDCIKKTFEAEGLQGFYKGSLASYMRFGPHFMLVFPLYERIRKTMGLDYL
jgi:hypothetical protein